MAGNYWIKLYIEILDDPKMGLLPDSAWRLAVELFLMAGEINNGGQLPTTAEIAWKLRRPCNETLQDDIKTLENNGIIEQTDNGLWFVINYATRQAAVPVAERVRQHRKRKNLTGKNGNVTKRYTESESESDTESKETESDGRRGSTMGEFWKIYETEIGAITPLISQRFGMYSEECPVEWLIDSVQIAVENNIRKPNYVFGCLDKAIAAGKSPRFVFPQKTTQSISHPAIDTYCTITRRPPPIPEVADEIIKAVGSDPEDINFFKQVMVAGIKLGWRSNGVSWILDHFNRREVPARQPKERTFNRDEYTAPPPPRLTPEQQAEARRLAAEQPAGNTARDAIAALTRKKSTTSTYASAAGETG